MKNKVFWTITAWVNAPERDGKSFKLQVTPEFLKLAARFEYNRNVCQDHVQILAREAGLTGHVQLVFGQYGLRQINHPDGDGCWLAIDPLSVSEQAGATFSSHNCDKEAQRSFLIQVWVWWVNGVTSE